LRTELFDRFCARDMDWFLYFFSAILFYWLDILFQHTVLSTGSFVSINQLVFQCNYHNLTNWPCW
jgi:hypothetical protein